MNNKNTEFIIGIELYMEKKNQNLYMVENKRKIIMNVI